MDLGGWAKADMANRYRKFAPDDLGERLRKCGWNLDHKDAPPPRPLRHWEVRQVRDYTANVVFHLRKNMAKDWCLPTRPRLEPLRGPSKDHMLRTRR